MAAELADCNPGVRARGLVHTAVMQRLPVDLMISTDIGFDHLEGIDRLDPACIEEGQGAIPTADEDFSSGAVPAAA